MKIKYFFINRNNDVVADLAQQEWRNNKWYGSAFRYNIDIDLLANDCITEVLNEM